ncbi:MAG: HD domain-containing protein [Elusimicrobiota bacterium]|jgi:poly(A) polymerase|nr:HD domain-containing protein [Elusimicrobiota bacterium]
MKSLQKVIFDTAPQAYYVGGILRDGILKRPSRDIDLALPRSQVKDAALKLAKILKGSAFEMDADFCVWHITAKNGLQIDLSAIIGKNIKEDLKRRDFTINALACPVSALPSLKQKSDGKILLTAALNNILDINDGIKDIKNKIIRANSKNVFKEDSLRLLRAYRTAAELGFTIDKNTISLIKKDAAMINDSAGERIQEELKRIFKCKGSKQNLADMDKSALLAAIFPPLEKQKNCARVYYGKGGVFAHTLNVVDRMEFLLGDLKKVFPKYYKKLLPFAQDAALYKTAALLHDIAKPKTAKMLKGRLRFFHHEERGAEMARHLLKKLRYSSSDTRVICNMIKYHLRPSNLSSNEIITSRGVYNFFKELGEAAIPMLLMCWADYASYITVAQAKRLIKQSSKPIMTLEEGKKRGALGKTLRHMQVVNFLFDKYFNDTEKVVLPRRFIDGNDIMSVLKIPSGKKVGEILEAAAVAQVEGKIADREQALAWLLENKKIFKS